MRKIRDNIHRAHDTFHHREKHRPAIVAGARVLIEGIREERVLTLAIKERLIRHIGKERYNNMRALGNSFKKFEVFRLRTAFRNKKQRRSIWNRVGLAKNRDLVTPRNSVPGLRGKFDVRES